MLPSSRRACQPFLMGKPLRKQLSPATRPKSGAPALKRFCPAGANSVAFAHLQRLLAPAGQGSVIPPPFPSTSGIDARNKKRRKPLPCSEKSDTGAGAMSDTVGFSENGNAAIDAFCSTQITKRCRRQAPARGPAAVCSDCRPIRNETQRARPLLVGRARVSMGPKALEAGTAGCASGPLRLRAAGPLGRWAAGPLGRWAAKRYKRVC